MRCSIGRGRIRGSFTNDERGFHERYGWNGRVKISVVTPNYNGGAYLEETIRSVLRQKEEGVDLEYIVVDGGSTDGSLDIIESHRDGIDILVCEKDSGPADAINKGFGRSSGDILAWLGADDIYYPGALKRVVETMEASPGKTLCFGHCPIVNDKGEEIRRAITLFKEFFFPLTSRFTVQSINYLSQPATFFRRSAWEKAGALRTDMVAAWDYDFILRIWRQGGAVRIGRPPLAAFRWHEESISGTSFRTQMREDWQVGAADAGIVSIQSLLHFGVWWGTVAIYSLMAHVRRRQSS